jgi:fatty-acid peroxygenase
MTPELTLRLLRRGYTALPGLGSGEAVPARMLGRRALVVRGAEGARVFYDPSLARRKHAIPAPLALLLFGRGAVHGLDDEAHAARKRMFLGLLDDAAVATVAARARAELAQAASYWPLRPRVVVADELVEAYGAAVLSWSGAGLPAGERRRRAHMMAQIVDGFGAARGTYGRAWLARARADRWATGLVRDVRRGRRRPPEGSPLHEVALGAGRDLAAWTAGVELLNVLRPTVAVSWLGCFAVLALQQHPQWRDRVRDDARARRAFAQEVRRTAPFVPALTARARRDLVWHGQRLPAGRRLVLDVRGTNLDPAVWPDPETFDPGRFLGREPDAYEMVPQGGGPVTGHRCPGEGLTLALLEATLEVVAGLDLEVRSGADVDLTRMPTTPSDGVVVSAQLARP